MDDLRRIILGADARIIEEQKWKKPSNPEGVPVWSHAGIVCVGNVLKGRVRLTFPNGASLPDPKKMFNARLDSRTVRAVDVAEEDRIDRVALRRAVRAAVALNLADAADKRH
jgi:hypothetical protein